MIEMEAGRELNVLVAEKVMGFVKYKMDGREGYGTPDRKHWYSNFSPSIDIEDAWQVLKRLSELEIFLSVHKLRTCYQVCWSTDLDDEVEADTAPHAICLAALKAVDR